MRSYRIIVVTVVAVALGGCVQNSEPGVQLTVPAGDSPVAGDPPEGDTQAVGTPAIDTAAFDLPSAAVDPVVDDPSVSTPCDAWPKTPTWAELDPTGPLFGTVQMRVSANGGLLFSSAEFGGVVHRTADGQLLGSVNQVNAAAMDATWTLTAVADQPNERVRIREVTSGITLAELVVPASPVAGADWLRDLRATITPDGATAVAIMCWDQPGEGPEATVVAAWDVETGEVTLSQTLEAHCGQHYWASRPPLLTTPDSTGAVLPFPGAPILAYVDLVAGQAVLVDLDAEPVALLNKETAPFGLSPVLSLAMSPTGHAVAVVDQSAQLRLLALPTLAQLGDTVPAGLALVNQHTYVPTVESPLAWAPTGDRVAFVGTDGEPTLLDTESGEVVATLERPRLEEATPWSGPTEGFLMGFAFGPDGRTLLAAGEAGMASWRCDSIASQPVADPATETPPLVTIDTPTELVVGQTVTIGVAAQGVAETALFTLVLDDEPITGLSSFGGVIELTTWQAGVHTLAIVVDDGVSTAISAPVEVMITPADG